MLVKGKNKGGKKTTLRHPRNFVFHGLHFVGVMAKGNFANSKCYQVVSNQ